MLKSVSEPKGGAIATAVGLVLLLVGATTVFAELQDDLDRVWKVPARARRSGVWGWARSRILSFGMILATGFLLVVSLVASATISALGAWWGPLFGGWETLAQAIDVVLSLGFVTAMFAFIYRFMPDVRIEWRDVWTGAGVTAVLFTVGKYLIGLYIGKSSVASGFGAAGSLAVLLLWVYYSAQIFLLGAEFTWVYAHSYGSRRDKPAVQEPVSATVPTAREPASSKAATAVGGPPSRSVEFDGVAGGIQRHPLRRDRRGRAVRRGHRPRGAGPPRSNCHPHLAAKASHPGCPGTSAAAPAKGRQLESRDPQSETRCPGATHDRHSCRRRQRRDLGNREGAPGPGLQVDSCGAAPRATRGWKRNLSAREAAD
jgi:membrane protein